jgi:hypothetical protein
MLWGHISGMYYQRQVGAAILHVVFAEYGAPVMQA